VTEILDTLCEQNLKKLHEYYLITGAGARNVMSTEYSNAMARYYVPFETMKLFMALKSKAKISEIVR
jgi:ATP-dependent DNA helicase HFM1/MER3